MKSEKNFIDYGIYIDRKTSYIISLNHVIHEQFIMEDTYLNTDGEHGSSNGKNPEHLQNSINEGLKKFCKLIISKLDNAHKILIFGPSVSKFELQKEIQKTKHLKHVTEELMVTDNMEREAAIRFTTDYYTPVTIGQEIFTLHKQNK